MKSSNEKGNPFHDEEGKFTSGEGASSGKKEYKPTPEKGSFAAEWLKGLTNKVEEEDPVGDLLGKLKKMNAVGEEEVSEETKSKLGDMGFKDKEESDPRTFVDNWGKEHKLDGSGYEVFSNEDGSFTIQDGTFVLAKFNSVDELPEAGFTEDEIKELTTEGSLYFGNDKLGEMGFGESPDVEEDEDYERSWGPKEEEWDYPIHFKDLNIDMDIDSHEVKTFLADILSESDDPKIEQMSNKQFWKYISHNYDSLLRKYEDEIEEHFLEEYYDIAEKQAKERDEEENSEEAIRANWGDKLYDLYNNK